MSESLSRENGAVWAGSLIKQAREAAKLDLNMLASTLKVLPSKLEALEAGRLEELPDASFARALALKICRILKIDPTEILAALPQVNSQPKWGHLTDGLNQPFSTHGGGLPRQMVSDWLMVLKPRVLILGLVLSAALGAYLLSSHKQNRANLAGENTDVGLQGESPDTLPGHNIVTSTLATPAESETVAASGVDVTAKSVATSVGVASAATAVPAVNSLVAPMTANVIPATSASAPTSASAVATAASGNIANQAANTGLRLEFTADSWVEVRDKNGRTLVGRLVHPGEVLSFNEPLPLKLKVGNVGGVAAYFQGQRVDLSRDAVGNIARKEFK